MHISNENENGDQAWRASIGISHEQLADFA